MLSKYSGVDTVVYTVSKVSDKNRDDLENITRDCTLAAAGAGFKNVIGETTTYRDNLLVTGTSLSNTPDFSRLVELEKIIESFHKGIPGYSSTEGHVWFLMQNKYYDYEQYVDKHYPEITASRPIYMNYLQPVSGIVAKLDNRAMCRTAFFNYPLDQEGDEGDILRFVRKTVDEDWPTVRDVIEIKL